MTPTYESQRVSIRSNNFNDYALSEINSKNTT